MTDPHFDTVADMTGLVVRTLDEVEDCGITVVHEGRTATLAYSSELAALDDESQYALGVGPCLDALDRRAQVESRDLARETRWGGYPATAVSFGLRSVLSMPLEDSVGALNLYSYRAGAFSEATRTGAAEFVDIVGRIARAATSTEAPSEAAERLRAALRRRSEVEQAVGILMAQHAIDYTEAFGMLLRISRERGEGFYAAVARIRDRAGGPES